MKKSLSALVVDDDPQVRAFVANVLRGSGWSVCEAATAEESFEVLREQQWALVFCDVTLGGLDGYAVLRRFTREQPAARFVLMTGHGSAAGALDATAIGAFDYLVKPFTVDDILNLAEIVREQHKLRAAPETAKKPAVEGYVSDIPLIGQSPAFVECLKLVGRVANTNLPVLISGESGTGKEIVARAIHQRSRRAPNAFVAVNCGAIPGELIESELFGHSKGSFTGADRERRGLWEEANRGTILLDEITETSANFQVKLLRALQQGEIRRVGSNQTVKVDVRVIAATNRDIEEEVRRERFRSDLMYRLNAVTIHLPPLRERIEDIPMLVEHFVRENTVPGTAPANFSDSALRAMAAYEWTGNVRELENAVLHALALADDVIYPEHLPPRIRSFSASSTPQNTNPDLPAAPASFSVTDWPSLAEMEGRYVGEVLKYTDGNKQAASRLLHIDRKTLARIIKRSGRTS
jgi:two-component system, NtrC family, response regulator AtoC